jgi:hypothetical protein
MRPLAKVSIVLPSLFASLASVAYISPEDEEWQRLEILGTIIVIEDRYVEYSAGGQRVLWDQLAPELVTVTKQLLRDVRCSSNSADRDLTSKAEGTSKWATATKMYNVAKGLRQGLAAGQIWTVTWADGGTTSYVVTGAFGDAALGYEPVSESEGDGVVKAGPVCAVG